MNVHTFYKNVNKTFQLTLNNAKRTIPKCNVRYINDGPNNDFQVLKTITNRNPRNLELMLIATKPLGYELDYPSRKFWHKLHLQFTRHDIKAKLVHNSGKTIVQADTAEEAISKFIYSPKSMNTVENLARIFAQRCLETGIHFVHSEQLPIEQSPKLDRFITVLELEGVKVGELDTIPPIHRNTL